MNKSSVLLIGAGLLAVTAALTPLTASADSDDEALAFIVGAAVGHVISDGGHHIRYVHRPHYRHGSHVRLFRWHARHDARFRHLKRDHRRLHRYDRHDHGRRDRWDRHDRDHRRGWDRDHRRGHGRS